LKPQHSRPRPEDLEAKAKKSGHQAVLKDEDSPKAASQTMK